ncbi:unnamed protein product [Alternaria burnsii]|nr:unnamed protein product [Alternaria burnsii]
MRLRLPRPCERRSKSPSRVGQRSSFAQETTTMMTTTSRVTDTPTKVFLTILDPISMRIHRVVTATLALETTANGVRTTADRGVGVLG